MESPRARDPPPVVASLEELQAREEARFVETHPRSRELAERARTTLFEGVPMHWMRKWPGGFPVLNRGILLTPFHNMALMSPATTAEDVNRHTEVFREAVLELAANAI